VLRRSEENMMTVIIGLFSGRLFILLKEIRPSDYGIEDFFIPLFIKRIRGLTQGSVSILRRQM
jgi:hypothetical protein